MALAPGSRLGPYEVTAQIGVGGMGEVYRATDTNLARQVAIKVLPEAVEHDVERLNRFDREAKTLAALNHPNIAQIHGIEKSDGQVALVMELVEGPTLDEVIHQAAGSGQRAAEDQAVEQSSSRAATQASSRTAGRGLPVAEALRIARQIADALEAAHEQGIIHRDLKPANIKVRDDGTVKVLDFGLAKAIEPSKAMSPSTSQSPTITSPAMTEMGMILGTAAYMAPEQARGRPVDKRADIWAFGCVLYEMLTGRRVFEGDAVSSTLAKVLEREPAFDVVPVTVPPAVQTLLRRCLQKDPRQRVRDMGDVRLALEGAFDTAVPAESPVIAPAPWTSRRLVPLAVGSLATAAVLGLAAWLWWPGVDLREVTRFQHVLPEGQHLRDGSRGVNIAVSPDGRRIAYLGNFGGIYLRPLDAMEATLLPGTQGALGNLFFSPDGASLGYMDALSNTLMQVPVAGGSPAVLAPAARAPWPMPSTTNNPRGVTWAEDGNVYFALTHPGIVRVPESGGTPVVVIPTTDRGSTVSGPQLLPDGESLLFTFAPVSASSDQAQIVVQSLRTNQRTVIHQGGRDGRYLPTGHLVYVQNGTLYAVPFDVDRLRISGTPIAVESGVMAGLETGEAQYSISRSGTLVYLSGSPETARRLAFVDLDGTEHPIDLPVRPYTHPRLSPDGARLAVETQDDTEIWVYNIRTRGFTRLTFGGGNRFPIWTPDGRDITFQSSRGGDLAIYRQRADNSGIAERLTQVGDGQARHEPESWSPDGTLSFDLYGPGVQGVWMLSAAGDHTPRAFVDDAEAIEKHSAFSRDGKWLAYTQSFRGTIKVLVQPVPATGALYQVSPDQGRTPVWSRDGTSLFYHDPGTNQLMVVTARYAPGLEFGPPVALPILGTIHPFAQRNFDVTPDGRQLLVVLPATTGNGSAIPSRIQVVQNWFEDVKRRVPVE